MLGTTTLGAEIATVSAHCIWILIDDEELALPYSEFSWFRRLQFSRSSTSYDPRLAIAIGLI
jgi:hypothetical protein